MAVLVLLRAWQGEAYVEYSDGVYAASARLVLHGLTPYRDFAAAQPPGIFYAGAGVLALGDSVWALRTALAAADLALAALVLVAVRDLTGRLVPAALAGLASLLAPWALREHAQLLPETFGAPLLLGAALAASRRGLGWLAGLLGGAAALFKLPFLLPAAAIAAVAAPRRAAVVSLAVVLVVGFGLAGALLGSDLWRGILGAQRQTGLVSVHDAGALWLQAVWNLLPLAVPAVLALRWRGARDPALFRTVTYAASVSLLMLAGLAKNGSYLNAIVAVEPLVLVLAACGLTWAVERRSPGALALGGAALALGIVQVGSLLASPSNPRVFARPAAATPPAWPASDGQVARRVAAARACPPGTAYSGPPYLAFAAGRRLPGNQPDQFIVTQASTMDRFLAAANRDRARCP